MARQLRLDYPGAWHHAMNRGAAKQQIFTDDRDRYLLLSLLGRGTRRFGLEVHAFCFLDNHFHLLVRAPQAQLSTTMQFVAREYTQRYNRRWNRDGALFRGRFHSVLVNTDRYLDQVSRYIHRNPIGARIVTADRLVEYQWSSYPAYLDRASGPAWLSRFELMSARSSRDFRRYVESEAHDPGFDSMLEKQLWGTTKVLDDEASVRQSIERPVAVSYGAKRPQRLELAMIDDVVTSLSGSSLADLQHSTRGVMNVARLVAVELSATLTGSTRQALAEHYAFATLEAVSSTVARANAQGPGGPVDRLRRSCLAELAS